MTTTRPVLVAGEPIEVLLIALRFIVWSAEHGGILSGDPRFGNPGGALRRALDRVDAELLLRDLRLGSGAARNHRTDDERRTAAFVELARRVAARQRQ